MKSISDVLSQFYQSVRQGKLHTFIPLLSFFYLRGKPMTLAQHYQFAPMYNTVMPNMQLWMTGRQVGKSQGVVSSTALRCALLPYYHTMLVQPRADQIERLNNTIMKPLLQQSPIQSQIITRTELSKMALKQFKSGSMLYMDFCFWSPDRLRGASGLANIILDEIQDIEYSFLPVIQETTSASQHWGYTQGSGTPKTTDTTLGLLWARSSQAEWTIKCAACGYENIPNPQQDMLHMIGKHGIICAKCGRTLNTGAGRYIHGIPSRAPMLSGYHVSQLVHPFHLDPRHPLRWQKLLYKVQNYDTLSLYNEVFGWPYDQSSSPLTVTDLTRAMHHIKITCPQDIMRITQDYRMLSIGVDWSGGAQLSDSYTAMVVVGLRKDSDVVDILYGYRFPKRGTVFQEANQVLRWVHGTAAQLFAHDNSGPGGFLRMEIMKQYGLMQDKQCTVIPYTYVGNMTGDIIRYHPPTRQPDHYYYSLDKSRSLGIMIQAIKQQRIRVTQFTPGDQKDINNDFLALRQDSRMLAGNNSVMFIIKKPGVPDDIAHAANFAVSAIWDRCHAFPALGPSSPVTDQAFDTGQDKFYQQTAAGPRSQFKYFQQALLNRPETVEPQILDWNGDNV